MKTILLIIFILSTLNLFSQNKEWSGDTTYWYNYQKQLNNKLGLDDISNSRFPFAFRISSLNTIIDIWTEDGKNFMGYQILFTSTAEDNPKRIKYFLKKETIKEDTVQLIEHLIKSYDIQYLPVQDSIKGWGDGLDGTIYLIEFSTPKSYSFKSYWTPTEFPSIPEAVSISNFVSKVEDLLMQNQKFDNFINSLPADKSYRYGNSWTVIRINSKIKKRINTP